MAQPGTTYSDRAKFDSNSFRVLIALITLIASSPATAVSLMRTCRATIAGLVSFIPYYYNRENLRSALIGRGFSVATATKITKLRPDIASRIARDPSIRPVFVYRGLACKFDQFDPKYALNLRNFAGDRQSIWVSHDKRTAASYAHAGIIVEFEVPDFMLSNKYSDDTQILNSWIWNDQAPFIRRIGILREKNHVGEHWQSAYSKVEEYIEEWRDYPASTATVR